MDTTKTTFYLPLSLQQTLKRRALDANLTISAYIQQAIVQAIGEDLEDLEAMEARKTGTTEALDDFLAAMKKDGLL